MQNKLEKESLSFPEGFLWGTATAGYQVEGNNINSDAWLMEQLPQTLFQELSGDTCDFYHRYEDDLLMLKLLGFNAFRFGIEWSRIEPVKGQYSQGELNHYSRIVDRCLELGITPVITLHHFTSPRWLISAGGWENPKVAEWFAAYTRIVVEQLGNRVTFFCTLNEVNTPLQLSIDGLFPINVKEAVKATSAVAAPYFGVEADTFCPFFPNAYTEKSIQCITEAHRQAVEVIHSIDKGLKVGVTINLRDVVEVEPSEVAQKFQEEVNLRFLKEIGSIGDFVGVQNYTRIRFNKEGLIADTEGTSDSGEFLDTTSLINVCKLAQQVTGKHILITEHGVDFNDKDDERRIDYVGESLVNLAAGIKEENLDILGYIHWSLMDNYEWFRGYSAHFGLASVKRETQERILRPSAYWLGNIARKNHI